MGILTERVTKWHLSQESCCIQRFKKEVGKGTAFHDLRERGFVREILIRRKIEMELLCIRERNISRLNI